MQVVVGAVESKINWHNVLEHFRNLIVRFRDPRGYLTTVTARDLRLFGRQWAAPPTKQFVERPLTGCRMSLPMYLIRLYLCKQREYVQLDYQDPAPCISRTTSPIQHDLSRVMSHLTSSHSTAIPTKPNFRHKDITRFRFYSPKVCTRIRLEVEVNFKSLCL